MQRSENLTQTVCQPQRAGGVQLTQASDSMRTRPADAVWAVDGGGGIGDSDFVEDGW